MTSPLPSAISGFTPSSVRAMLASSLWVMMTTDRITGGRIHGTCSSLKFPYPDVTSGDPGFISPGAGLRHGWTAEAAVPTRAVRGGGEKTSALRFIVAPEKSGATSLGLTGVLWLARAAKKAAGLCAAQCRGR